MPTEYLEKFNAQAVAPIVQIGRICSGSLFYSKRDETSGEVLTLVLTAKHCVKNTNQQIIYVPTYHGNRLVKEDAYKAKLRNQSWSSDLAIYELLDKQTFFANVVRFASPDVVMTPGEDVWTVGYALGHDRTITDGVFGNRQTVPFPDNKDTEYFRSTPQIVGGDSGGALFRRTAEGDFEQIGVTTAVIPTSDFYGLYTPIDKIDEFFKRVWPGVQKTYIYSGM